MFGLRFSSASSCPPSHLTDCRYLPGARWLRLCCMGPCMGPCPVLSHPATLPACLPASPLVPLVCLSSALLIALVSSPIPIPFPYPCPSPCHVQVRSPVVSMSMSMSDHVFRPPSLVHIGELWSR